MAMTKKEIINLRAEFQKLVEKVDSHDGVPLMTGLKYFDAEVGKCTEGPASEKLRQFGQLLKHYIEEIKKKPGATIRFNVAAGLLVNQGLDVQQAIRRARATVDASVRTMEVEGFCTPKDHTALRVDRHDRVLQQILNT